VRYPLPQFLFFLLWGTLLGGPLGAVQEVPNLSFVVPQDSQTIGGPNVLVWVAEEQPCGAAVVFETSSDGNRYKVYRSEEDPGPGQCSHRLAWMPRSFPRVPFSLGLVPVPRVLDLL
jgi:hypothetical protein